MDRFQKNIGWTILLSQMTHVFCCGIPIFFSVLSFLSGFGLLGGGFSSVNAFHDVMHHWEMPLLVGSGVLLLFGWGLHAYSYRLDCRAATSCSHEPCTPKKRKSGIILTGATLLFVANVAMFFFLDH